MSHTPGPWECDDENDICARNSLIAVAYMPTPPSDDEWDANARLIAAAPDLLAALRDVIGWIPGGAAEMWHTDAPTKAVERARAAIAKAEGK